MSITLVAPKAQAFGGKTSLSFDDLGSNSAGLPRDIVEPGTKRLLDPAKLRPFGTLRKQMHRSLLAVGSRADGGGYLVPTSRIPQLATRMADIEKKWNDAKARFLSEFPAAVESWASEHDDDGWGAKIRAAAPSVADLNLRIFFTVRYRQFGAPEGEAAKAVGDGGMKAELGELPLRIVEEISADAAEVAPKGRAEGLKAALERALLKFDAWSWIDARVETLRVSIRKFLDAQPKNHREWDASAELMARTLCEKLADPVKVLAEVERGEIVVSPPPPPPQLLLDVGDLAAPPATPFPPAATNAMLAIPQQPSVVPAIKLQPPSPSENPWAGLGW